MKEFTRNHYVAQWHQRRFLAAGETHFHVLDLSPPKLVSPGGVKFSPPAIQRRGTPSCFVEDDLYTMKLGRWTSDAIERSFFGPIDRNGKGAVEFFEEYSIREGVHEAFNDLADYMNAQRFRTPRGLDWLKIKIGTADQNIGLDAMRRLFRLNATMWAEGVWEIVRADPSPTKFLLTDNPVTFYNPKAFPLSAGCRYPDDVGLGHVGTRTLFPLSRDRLLIITHLQFVRDPWLNPLKPRVNARAFQAPRPLDLRAIQTHRELQQDEVIRINLVLKKRATRFVAASNKDWLYPEEQASADHWSKLDDDWFLMPNPYKVPFTTGFSAGWDDGRSWASDEHGRTPGHPDYEDGRLRDREWAQHNKAKLAWARKREGRSLSQVLEFNYIEDEIMREDLAKYHEERQRHRRDKHNN